MATYFDHFHHAIVRIVPDFRRLRAGSHKADPRAATSIVIAGMTLGLAVMLGLTIAEPVRIAAPSKPTEHIAPPPAADKVTIVSANPQLDVPCAEQTWPYIDRRCLTETTQKRPQSEALKSQEPPPPIDATKATAPVIPVVAPEQAGTSETPRRAARETTGSAPAADSRDERIAAKSEPAPTELDTDAEPAPAMAPPIRRSERRRVADPGQRIVRRWKEFIHELPGGGSRRVTIFPRGMF